MPRKKSDSTATDPLIQEIRDRYAYASQQWKESRDEAEDDMRCIAEGPWSDADLNDRANTGRPAMCADELSQYINQAINNFRQNQIGIKVQPAGNKATDQTALLHQGMIRGIEYDSNAQRSAYTPAFENALQRSYGFFKITRQYLHKSFNQKIVIKGIPNPDVILYDPDVLESDWSDAKYVFELSPLSKKEFKRKYPKAKVQDFSAEDMRSAPDWIREDHVVTAAYWKAEIVQRKLMMFDGPEGQLAFYEDELPEKMKGMAPARAPRLEDTRKITQYITNGIEILETIEQPGTIIPIIAVIGKEMYVPDGKTSKRVLVSLVRLARDPYMAYCYLWSQMAEEAKMTPKAPLIGYVGQFETDKDAFDSLTSQPRAYVQADPVVDGATGQVLPLPTRPQFTPNFTGYIQAMEAAKRAIQAAMGINPLPTPAQKQNEKSGVALGKIEQQESVGSFHFTANIHRSIELAGRVIEEWLPVVYDTEREVSTRKDDGTHQVVKINTPQPYMDDKGQMQHNPVSDDGQPYGEHQIEITTGPSYQSQRDEADDFLSTIIQNIEALPIAPPVKSQFMALIIKFKNMGPLGDQMAALLAGSDDAQQLQGKLGQLQQTAQQQHDMIGQLTTELQKLQAEKQGKVVDNEYKMAIVKLQEENKLTIAEVNTMAQNLTQRMQTYMDMMQQFHGQAHDAATQASDQAHEKGMADINQANVLEQGQQSGDQQAQLSAQGADQAQQAAENQPAHNG